MLATARGVQTRYQGWRRSLPGQQADDAHPFRRLLGDERWAALPAAVRERFRRRIGPGGCLTYVGEVTECRMSRLGWLVAQLARMIGSPLPLHRDTGVPACVTVTEDRASGGQFWTRQYGRRAGFPQVIYSAKRFTGPTGLEEYLGLGVGIALGLVAEGGVLSFVSDHIFWRLGTFRLRLPRWLSPHLTVAHIDCGHGRFVFTLDLTHPLAGRLVRQVAVFADPDIKGEAA